MPTLIEPLSRFPDFDLPLVSGEGFDLHKMPSPEKFTVIVAYRGLHCPKCRGQLQAIEPKVKDLEAQGYKIVAVSMDGKEKAEETVKTWELKDLPLAYDMGLLMAKSLGLFISDQREGSAEPKLFSEPGLFVIKPDGSLYAEYIQNTPFGRPPLGEIIAGLEFVVKNDYPTRGTSTA